MSELQQNQAHVRALLESIKSNAELAAYELTDKRPDAVIKQRITTMNRALQDIQNYTWGR